MQVNGANPYATQYAGASQPVTYSPGMPQTSAYGAGDQYTPQQPGQKKGSFMGSLQKRKLVTRQSVMMGAAGAAAGFMLGGPVGAIIGGAIALLLSVIMNYVASKKAENGDAGQQPPPAANISMYQGQSYNPYTQQQQMSSSELYYQRQQQDRLMQQGNR